MSGYVLDTFALLAFLRDETGGPKVRDLIEAAAGGQASLHLSLINYGEVLYTVERRWGESRLRQVIVYLENLPVHLSPVDQALILVAAHVKATHPLSYADSFAVALALEKEAIIVTGDPEFHCVEDLVEVMWLAQEAGKRG